MAKTGISEFTFGFAFLHEQANKYSEDLIAAPILPSLIQEEEEGWDACLPVIGGTLFYQFKLSEYLTRSNAKFIKDGTYSSPYYCFKLHKRNKNNQHNRLLELSVTEPNVFYVAPEFNGTQAFNNAYLNKKVSEKSKLIPLTECNYIDDDEQHYITYQEHNPLWAQHSEIKWREISYRGDQLSKLYRSARFKKQIINQNYIISLYERIASPLIYNKFEFESYELSEKERHFISLGDKHISAMALLHHTANVVRIFYDAILVIAGEKFITEDERKKYQEYF